MYSQAALLLGEHPLPRLELEAIIDEADRAARQPPQQGLQRGKLALRCAMRIGDFCDRLREHERRECELIQQAYREDIGVSD